MSNAKRPKTIDVSEMELMTINQLLNLIDINLNNRMGRIAAKVYGQKYGDMTVCLSMQEVPIKKVPVDLKVAVKIRDDNAVDFRVIPLDACHCNDAVQFIRKIGHMLTRIEINYSIKEKTTDARRWRAIERLIMDKCSALLHLTLEQSNGDAFFKLRKQFQKCESLWLENCLITSNIADITSLFPNVCQLIVDQRGFGDHQHFHNSSIVSQTIIAAAKRLNGLKCQHFMYSNPQLENLLHHYGSVKENVMHFLDVANKNMPRLEHIELYDLDMSNAIDVIHFQHVRYVVIRLHETKPVESIPLSFPAVETLEIYGDIESKVAVMNFVVDAKTLVGLDFNLGRLYGDIDVELQQFANKLEHLEEIIITEYDRAINMDILKECIVKCKTLRKLNIRFPYGNVERRNALADELSREIPNWKVDKWCSPCKPCGFRIDLILHKIEVTFGNDNQE
ncbi:uncharacterized protein LOC116346174 [Contarinia nasturtii]|uniref:uncharacterized protein LOC116346174 n=1 Tax=Contarinia nasturtii TaxID=265458 RepID=UPI0012D4AE1C|nr:uncharacterized protein LOC116346174 [Contarinia nasturtii]